MSVTLRRDLAYAYQEIGNTELALGNGEAALEEYRRTLKVFEAMAAADPKSTDGLLGVAMSHHNVGEALVKLGRSPEALVALRLARPAYEQIVAAAPSNVWVAGMLAMLYARTAELGAGTDQASSCALYGKAIALFEPIAAAGSLAPDRRAVYERAKEQALGCRDRG